MLLLFSNNNIDTAAREQLEKRINSNTKVLCFSGSLLIWQTLNPNEFKPEGNYFTQQFEPFKNLGVKEENFTIVHPLDNKQDVRDTFYESDIIVFLGGYMEALEDILIKFDLWITIQQKKYVIEKDYIGFSAGAMIMLDKYNITPYIDPEYNYYSIREGLGLLKDCRIIVHFNEEFELHQIVLNSVILNTIEEMAETNRDIITVALSDHEGIMYHNDELKVLYGE